jgi:hypothetical protein
VLVFARPNVPHSHVLGLPGYDRYGWLPAPPGVMYRPPHLVPADGRQIQVEDATHPFSPLIDRFQSWFTYRAAFSERLPDFASYGRVLMRSAGGAAVGVELRVGPGRIIFLPALDDVPSGEMRFELATAIHDAVRRAIAGEGDEDAPAWVKSYTVPGLDEQEAEVDRLRSAAREAQDRLTEAEARTESLGRYRRMLWMETRQALDPVVRQALRELGFYVTYDESYPITIEADGRTAYVEVEGADEQVVEWPYLRLQRRLEKDMLQTAVARKGVLVINGERRRNPERRGDQWSPALRVASENYRFALLTTAQLFDLVRSAREDPSADNLRAMRDTIFTCDGPLIEPSPAHPPTEEISTHDGTGG